MFYVPLQENMPKELLTAGIDSFETPRIPLKIRSRLVLDQDWYLLPGTGFDVRGQINKLTRDLNNGLGVSRFLEDTAEDIKHFVLEYPQQRLVFPIFLDVQQRDGENRVVAPRYGEQIYLNLISEQERAGSVKRSIQNIEEFLVDAVEGSVAVLVSPPGWSGLDDRQGGEIIFVDNQIYIFKKTKTGITARTIRTGLSLEESELFLEKLESLATDPNNLITQEDRILNVVSSPSFLRNGGHEYSFEDIVGILRSVKRENFAYQGRSFAEIYHDLSLGDRLIDENKQIQQLVEPLIEQFEKFVFSQTIFIDEEAIDRIEAELGKTILRIHQAIKLGNPKKEVVQRLIFAQDEDLKIAHQELKQIRGCNGGGSTSTIMTAFGAREIISRTGLSYIKSEWFCESCPVCGSKINCEVKPGGKCPKCPAVRECV